MMTRKQKHIIAVLAIVNLAIILTLVALTTRSTPKLPTPQIPTLSHSQTPKLGLDDCQWRATQLLAQAGLGGTITRTANDSLDLEINYPLAPSQTADDVAQTVWTAFDVVMALQESPGRCPAFTRIQVTIRACNDHSDIQINANTSAADLFAFGAGDLSQDEFIGRVTFYHTTMHNE